MPKASWYFNQILDNLDHTRLDSKFYTNTNPTNVYDEVAYLLRKAARDNRVSHAEVMGLCGAVGALTRAEPVDNAIRYIHMDLARREFKK